MQYKIPELSAAIEEAGASFNALFQEPRDGALAIRATLHQAILDAYVRLLACIRSELQALGQDTSEASRYFLHNGDAPDSIDYMNRLADGSHGRPFAQCLQEAVWDAVRGRWPLDEAGDALAQDPVLIHVLQHAARLFKRALAAPEAYMRFLAEHVPSTPAGLAPRLDPRGLGQFDARHTLEGVPIEALTAEDLQGIKDSLKALDDFATGRTFRAVGRAVIPCAVGDIRKLQDFYGYKAERRFFADHFSAFATGGKVDPLLLQGLPGVGKTHLTIAYALSRPEIILIHAEQEQLQDDLESIIDYLRRFHYRRFVLFFDDVDPERVEWSMFRHQVDGYLPYATNVAIVIASNYDFPARIRSRCLAHDFRPMDPDVCEEFVADYLFKHKGIRCEDETLLSGLVSTIACDFVHEYRNGPLNELSPRSIARYFDMLDARPQRMKGLISKAGMGIIQLPDEDTFIESARRIQEMLQEEREE